MYEIIFSMIMAQSYNVYRYVDRNLKQRQLGPSEFKIAVIKGLMSSIVVIGEEPDEPPPRELTKHHLMQYQSECFTKWHYENSHSYVHSKQDLDLS